MKILQAEIILEEDEYAELTECGKVKASHAIEEILYGTFLDSKVWIKQK